MSQLIITGGFGETTAGSYADIDWSKSKHSLIFNIETNDVKINLESYDKSFNIVTNNVKFNINTVNTFFKIQTYDVNFMSKQCQ